MPLAYGEHRGTEVTEADGSFRVRVPLTCLLYSVFSVPLCSLYGNAFSSIAPPLQLRRGLAIENPAQLTARRLHRLRRQPIRLVRARYDLRQYVYL